MPRILTAFLIGLVFGSGIIVSGMGNPAKVLSFFDVAGNWDPSLLLVMASALLVTGLGYRLVLRRDRPVLENRFHLPTGRKLDLPLVLGSAGFGVGWGISGFCPGGAIPALGLGEVTAWAFVGAMLVGIAAARTIRLVREQRLQPVTQSPS